MGYKKVVDFYFSQEVEHCRHLAQLRATDDVGELLMFASAQTHNLILGTYDYHSNLVYM